MLIVIRLYQLHWKYILHAHLQLSRTCFDLSVIFNKFSNILYDQRQSWFSFKPWKLTNLYEASNILKIVKKLQYYSFVYLLFLWKHGSFCFSDCQHHTRIWIPTKSSLGFRVNSKLACEDPTLCCEPKLKPAIKLFICVLESTPALKYAGLHSIAVARY